MASIIPASYFDKTDERYRDTPDHRVLDLRPDGVDCLPLLEYCRFKAVQPDTQFHVHGGCVEFCLCVRGNLMFVTPDGCEFPFHPGHIFQSSPDMPHRLRANPSGLIIYSILFQIPKKGSRILGLDRRGSEWLVRSLTHLPKRLYAAAPEVRPAFERLFALYDSAKRRSPSRPVKMQAAVLNLLIALIESARRFTCRTPSPLVALANEIRCHPEADYPIDVQAQRARLSRSAFAEAFKRATGLPLHAFVLDCRIATAKQLLSRTDRSVAAIAQSLSFFSAQHFAKAFRRIVGCTPRDYRRERRSQPAGEPTIKPPPNLKC